MTGEIAFDKELLKERIDRLYCINNSNIAEPKNPGFKYTNNRYEIVEAIQGNKVDKNILYSRIVGTILNGRTEIDLEVAGCYVKPQYDPNSQKVLEAKNTLNKYVSAKITFIIRGNKVTLDGSKINHWLTVDNNFKVKLDERKVKDYVDVLANSNYGLSIDRNKETQNIILAIKYGKTIIREPICDQVGSSYGVNELGNTYVKINISKQHLWFYKNGYLVVQGDIVTGNVKTHRETPKGTYRLKYKARNVILKGPDYTAHVDYWMPFNGGIGIHDAKWRSVFGNGIYKTNGSHGCINLPYKVAKKIFENIKVGTPIICY
jgi:hypothetical protein